MRIVLLACCGWLATCATAIAQAQVPVAPSNESLVEPQTQAREVVPLPSQPPVEVKPFYVSHPPVWDATIKPWLQRTHWGYADEFHPMKFGVSVNEHFRTQICNGVATQLVLYAYDFRDNSGPTANLLNAHGQRQLSRIARMIESTGLHPLGIEASGDADLDAARREEVIRQLGAMQASVPAEWVVVGQPTSLDLRGVDAAEIYKNLLNHTKSGGNASVVTGSGNSMGLPTSGSNPPQPSGGQP